MLDLGGIKGDDLKWMANTGLSFLVLAGIVFLKRRNGKPPVPVEAAGLTYHQLGLILDEVRDLSRGMADYHRAVTFAERSRLEMQDLIFGHIGKFEHTADMRREEIKLHVTTTIKEWQERKAS